MFNTYIKHDITLKMLTNLCLPQPNKFCNYCGGLCILQDIHMALSGWLMHERARKLKCFQTCNLNLYYSNNVCSLIPLTIFYNI